MPVTPAERTDNTRKRAKRHCLPPTMRPTCCLPLLLLLLCGRCRALDPFAMFESESPPAAAAGDSGGPCCAEAGRCRRLLQALGPLRARWALSRRRCPAVSAPPPPRREDRRQLNSAFMQRHVARTLRLLRLQEDLPPAEREVFQLTARLTEQQVLRLRQFLAGSGGVSLVEVDSILEAAFEAADLESLLVEGRPLWLRRLAARLPAVDPELLPLLAAVLLAVWLVTALLLGRSWSHVLSRLAGLALLASFLWHWNHLYRRAVEERLLQHSPPAGCQPGDRGFTDGLLHHLRSMVSFVKPDAACRQYYARLHVDPFMEVSPGLALAETVTQLVLHPAEQLGRALGRFYSALGAEVPTLWLLQFTVLSLLFLLALVVVACRCRPPATAARPLWEPLHVTVRPGADTVFLLVTAEGEVQPVGEEARRRTGVQRAGPERLSWLAWTGRGLARSVSAGALLAGGAVAAGRRALQGRRRDAEPPVLAAADPGGAGDRPAVSDLTDTEIERPDRPTGDCSQFPGPAAEPPVASSAGRCPGPVAKPPVTPVPSVTSLTGQCSGPAAESPVTPPTGPASGGGGDAGSQTAAEVAPRGGGEGKLESPASPFLTRIKEVMDSSMEDRETDSA